MVVSSAGELLDHASADELLWDDARYMKLLDAAK